MLYSDNLPDVHRDERLRRARPVFDIFRKAQHFPHEELDSTDQRLYVDIRKRCLSWDVPVQSDI